MLHGNMEMLQRKIFENIKNQSTIKNKLKLDIDFLNNYKQLGVYPKFLIFKLPNTSSYYNTPCNRFYNNYVTIAYALGNWYDLYKYN